MPSNTIQQDPHLLTLRTNYPFESLDVGADTQIPQHGESSSAEKMSRQQASSNKPTSFKNSSMTTRNPSNKQSNEISQKKAIEVISNRSFFSMSPKKFGTIYVNRKSTDFGSLNFNKLTLSSSYHKLAKNKRFDTRDADYKFYQGIRGGNVAYT